MEIQKDILSNDWQVDDEVQLYLHQTAVLAKFVSAMGMVFAILTTAKTVYNSIRFMMLYNTGFFNTYSFVNIGGAALSGTAYFAISLFTFRFAVRPQQALKGSDQPAFDTAWHHFKMAYRVMGVMFIVYLALLLLIFLF